MRRQLMTLALVGCIGAATAFGAQKAAANAGPASGEPQLRAGQQEQKHKGHRGEQQYFKKMARELGLTDEQKTRAKALKEGMRAENKELFGTLRTEKGLLRGMIHSGTADEAAIRAQAAKVAAVEEELAVKKAQGAKQFLALLTPDQVEKYRALQAKREARREGRFGRFGGFGGCDDGPMK